LSQLSKVNFLLGFITGGIVSASISAIQANKIINRIKQEVAIDVYEKIREDTPEPGHGCYIVS